MTALFAFFIRLAGGKIQLAVWSAVILGGLWWWQHGKTVAFERGMLRGEVETLKDDIARRQAALATLEAEWALERTELTARTEALTSERNALRANYARSVAGLKADIGELAAKGSTLETQIRPLTGPAVDARARSAIAGARVADGELARIRAAQ